MTRPRVPAPAGVALVTAGVVGLALLRRQPLSWDEAVTVAEAVRPASAVLLTAHHTDAVLGLWYLLEHVWARVPAALAVRPTETWWRLPSAAATVATSVVVAVVARRAAGPVAAWVAGGTAAVLPLLAFYAVDARPYALATFTVTAAWAVWTGGRPTSGRRAVVTVLLLVLGAWLQLFTLLVWPAFVLVAGRAGWRRALVALAVAAAGVAPLAVVASGQAAEIGWVPPASVGTTLDVAVRVGGGVAVVLAVALLVALALRAGLVGRGPVTLAVLWWVLAPVTLLAAADLVRPVLVARYALVSSSLLAVTVGVVVARAGRSRLRRAVRFAAVAVVVTAVVTTAVQLVAPYKYEDYRAAAHYAATLAPAGTPVLFAPSSARLGFDDYGDPTRWRDLGLPAGVGADPLALRQLAPSLVREQVAASCRVLVVGDAPGARTSSIADAATLATVAGRAVGDRRSFGQVTVWVAVAPRCADPA